MLSGLVAGVVAAVGPVVAPILVLTRARRRARALGATGAILLLVVSLAQVIYSRLLPTIISRFGVPTGMISLLFLPGTLLSALGVILLGAAVGTAFRSGAQTGPPGPYGQPPTFSR